MGAKRIGAVRLAKVSRSFAPHHPAADCEGYVERRDGSVVHVDARGRRYVLDTSAGQRLISYLDPGCERCDAPVAHEGVQLCDECAEEVRFDDELQAGDDESACPPRE